jgi:hypothetical protein
MPVANPQPGQIVTIDDRNTIARWLLAPYWLARVLTEPSADGTVEVEILSDWTGSPRPYPHRPNADRRPREIVEANEGDRITIPVQRIAATKEYNDQRDAAYREGVARQNRHRIEREREANELVEACEAVGLKVELDPDSVTYDDHGVTVTSTAAEILELLTGDRETVEG